MRQHRPSDRARLSPVLAFSRLQARGKLPTTEWSSLTTSRRERFLAGTLESYYMLFKYKFCSNNETVSVNYHVMTLRQIIALHQSEPVIQKTCGDRTERDRNNSMISSVTTRQSSSVLLIF